MTKQLSDEVPDKEFYDMVLDERLKFILARRPAEEDKKVITAGDEVIARLDSKDREVMEAYLDMFTDNMASYERQAYLGGLRDGICLMKKLIL